MLRLQNDNDFLVDKHSSTSRQLQDQTIDIPNNVEVSNKLKFLSL